MAELVTPTIEFGDAGEKARVSGTNASVSTTKFRLADSWFGDALRVDFAAAERPEIVIQPERQTDWSRMGELAIPVRNPGVEAVNLIVRVDAVGANGRDKSRSGVVRIQPREESALVLPLRDNDAEAMGMRMGPPPAPPRLNGTVRVVGGAKGEINLHHVTRMHLALPYLSTDHTLIFGTPLVIGGLKADRSSYARIADQFGQYTRATWPEKIHSIDEMHEERRHEERLLKKWNSALPPVDRYGGLLQGATFKATGFFRTARTDSRWRLVTPDGHVFFSLGIDVVSPDVGKTYIEDREFMFAALPTKNGPLAAHFGKARSSDQGDSAHQRATFDFYAANLERKFGRDYISAWRSTAIARLRAWGFNTIGNWSEPHLITTAAMPYVVPIEIWGDYAQIPGNSGPRSNMPDVFDPKFAAAADVRISRLASRYKADPFLIGYFVDNERTWGVGGSNDPHWRYALAVHTLLLPAESPAKQAFVQSLIAKYHSAGTFASAWGVAVSSWDALRQDRLNLSNSTLTRPEIAADLSEFTARYAEAYFRIVATAIRHHDPNHLYLGSRFSQERTPEAIEACARYCDVVSFNIYDREISGDEWVRFHQLGKPAIIGEFQFGTADRGLFWPGLYNVGSEDQRGPAYSHYLRSALANPDIVGCHWFQYVDEPLTGRVVDGENGHVGFVSVGDVPYDGFVSAVRDVNLSLLWNGWR